MATKNDVNILVRIERDVMFPNGSFRTYTDAITLPVSDFLTANQTINLINAAKSAITNKAKDRIDTWKTAIIDAELSPPPTPTPQEKWSFLTDADLVEIKAIAISKGL